jgi:hypothetical protein
MSVTEETMTNTAMDSDADFFATSELPVPPAVPDVHFATIEAVYVTEIDNEKWPAQFVIKMKSVNDPTLEVEYKLILPAGFVNDVQVDAHTLPQDDYGDGDPRNYKAQSSYSSTIANSDGTATLQELRKLAKELGRSGATVEGLTKRPATLDEFVNNHALLLNGLEVAFYRNVNKKAEARFKNRLEVKGIVSRESAASPKMFKKGGYVKVFEQQ